MSEQKKKRPERLGDVLRGFLEESGLAKRLAQASVIAEWPHVVGPQIAAVTEPLSVTSDGVLFVAVKTHAWMLELSLMEPDLLSRLNRARSSAPVRKIRWQLKR